MADMSGFRTALNRLRESLASGLPPRPERSRPHIRLTSASPLARHARIELIQERSEPISIAHLVRPNFTILSHNGLLTLNCELIVHHMQITAELNGQLYSNQPVRLVQTEPPTEPPIEHSNPQVEALEIPITRTGDISYD